MIVQEHSPTVEKEVLEPLVQSAIGYPNLQVQTWQVTNLSRQGRRSNTGHTHSAGIRDGLFTGGLCGLLDQGYNRGPSSWSHTQIITYLNAKRALATMTRADWRGR